MLRPPYRILLHADDPLRHTRACVVRPDLGLVARCAAACGAMLNAETPHIHVVDDHGEYEGYCSEGCAIRGLARVERMTP